MAALFAIHPINVESVAVDSGAKKCFEYLLLDINYPFYVWYVKSPQLEKISAGVYYVLLWV